MRRLRKMLSRRWLNLLKPDDVISFGGSMSLRECGVMELLRSGSYPKLMDRDQKGLTREQVQEIYRKSFFRRRIPDELQRGNGERCPL